MKIADARFTCFGHDGRTYFTGADGQVWRQGHPPRMVMSGTDAPFRAATLATLGQATIVATDAAGAVWIIDPDDIARRREGAGEVGA